VLRLINRALILVSNAPIIFYNEEHIISFDKISGYGHGQNNNNLDERDTYDQEIQIWYGKEKQRKNGIRHTLLEHVIYDDINGMILKKDS